MLGPNHLTVWPKLSAPTGTWVVHRVGVEKLGK